MLDVALSGHSCRKIAARLSGLEVLFIQHPGNWPKIRAIVASLDAPLVVKQSRPEIIVETLAKA